jgi:hypothetical protein
MKYGIDLSPLLNTFVCLDAWHMSNGGGGGQTLVEAGGQKHDDGVNRL